MATPPGDDTGLIRVAGVHKTFRLGDTQVPALQDINLDIGRGEYLSVMGPSGSGKSTLLNMLGLLDRPDRGQYLLHGTDTVPLPEEARAALRARHIGFIFQSFHLIPRLTARENVELPLVLAGVAPEQRRPLVDAVLDRLGILRRADHGANQLSGGERQRVAIGRALVMTPELLLADEPTGNLDSASGREVMALLEDLNAQGLTLLVVTHDHELGQRARRRLRMRDGRIEQDERT